MLRSNERMLMAQWVKDEEAACWSRFLNVAGPVSIAVVIVLLSCAVAFSAPVPAVVRIAESQIGKGEMYGNNKGPIVKMYTRGKEVAWCAGFVSWTLKRSGRVHDSSYRLAARSYWKDYPHVQKPRPGDLAVFSRGRGQGHIGIVEIVRGQKITTIEGNVGRFPAKVKRVNYTLGHIPNLIGFVRI